MVNYILLSIGIILIGLSIFIIRKDLKRTEKELSEINKIEKNVKEYYKLTEEMIESFDDIIGSKVEDLYSKKVDNKRNIDKNKNQLIASLNSGTYSDKNQNNDLIKKVLELQSIGLNSEEIAKKLNRGIREVEIILKMYR